MHSRPQLMQYLLYKLCNLIMCVQIALKLGISMIHTWHKFIFNRFNDKFNHRKYKYHAISKSHKITQWRQFSKEYHRQALVQLQNSHRLPWTKTPDISAIEYL